MEMEMEPTMSDRATEEAAKVIRKIMTNGSCVLGRECGICDCIDPKAWDREARKGAREVLTAAAPFMTERMQK